MTKTSQPKTGKMAMVQLEKVDDRINRELSEDLSAEQEIEPENSNEASVKLISTSDDESLLTFHDLENTQNTSGETATSSAQDKLSSTSKTGTTKSSSTSSEEGGDLNSSNGEGEDNSDGNGSIPDDDYANDDEDDDEDSENFSDRSQSPEEIVKDDTDNTSKVNILRKKVKSPKSIASRIKEYSKKIGDKGVKYSISGPLPDYDIVGQVPKSDMKGFLSPRAKQDGFIPMAWNQGMMKSMSSAGPQETPQGHETIGNASSSEQNISTDEIHNPSTGTDDLSLMDPSHVDALPENIFSVSNPPVTSTPKTSKEKISQQCIPTRSLNHKMMEQPMVPLLMLMMKQQLRKLRKCPVEMKLTSHPGKLNEFQITDLKTF